MSEHIDKLVAALLLT